MRNLILTRTQTGDEGTFGHIASADGRLLLHTGECPRRNNIPFKSAIPHGLYTVNRHNSPKFGDCCILGETAPRTNILIHKGNFCGNVDEGWRSDVQGCIIVGKARAQLAAPKGPQECVVESRTAFTELMDILWHDGDDPWRLEIINAIWGGLDA